MSSFLPLALLKKCSVSKYDGLISDLLRFTFQVLPKTCCTAGNAHLGQLMTSWFRKNNTSCSQKKKKTPAPLESPATSGFTPEILGYLLRHKVQACLEANLNRCWNHCYLLVNLNDKQDWSFDWTGLFISLSGFASHSNDRDVMALALSCWPSGAAAVLASSPTGSRACKRYLAHM